jgi:TRAP-type C4-dicarboxylate transport system permease small subunit
MNSVYLLIVKILEKLVMFLLAAIVLVVTVQVFSRFILQSPSSVTEELARFLLIWIGLFGGAYGYHSNAHLGLDIFTNKLQGASQYLMSILAHSLIMLFAVVVMIIGGASLVSLTFEPVQISAALEIKMGYVYSAVPIAGGLIVFISLMKISHLFSQVSSSKKAA